MTNEYIELLRTIFGITDNITPQRTYRLAQGITFIVNANYNNYILVGSTIIDGLYLTITIDPEHKDVSCVITKSDIQNYRTYTGIMTVNELQEAYDNDKFFQLSTMYDMSSLLYFMETVKNIPNFIDKLKNV